MVRPGRDRLTGTVEADETYIGGLEEGLRGCGAGNKTLVIIAAQMVEKRKIGRIRMKQIPDASSEHLHSFISEAIEPGNMVITDGWPGYNGLERFRTGALNSLV